MQVLNRVFFSDTIFALIRLLPYNYRVERKNMDKHSLQRKFTEQLLNVGSELERDRELMKETDIMFDEGYMNALMYVIEVLENA